VNTERNSPLLYVMAAILFAETLLVGALTVTLVFEILVDTPSSYPSAIALAILAAVATVWGGFIAVHTLLRRPWIRGGAMVWQILQIAVAVGSFQGAFAEPVIGWWLLIPALAVIFLLFTKPVIAATTRPEER
jgi:small basic protein